MTESADPVHSAIAKLKERYRSELPQKVARLADQVAAYLGSPWEQELSFTTYRMMHSLAGSAQYWLGETFYAQGNFREAAQNFLHGYKNYPKSRRAPDSLLKLGISLNKLGQTQQACAATTACDAADSA